MFSNKSNVFAGMGRGGLSFVVNFEWRLRASIRSIVSWPSFHVCMAVCKG